MDTSPLSTLGAVLCGLALVAAVAVFVLRRTFRGADRPAFADLAEDEHYGLASAPERLLPCLLDLAKKVDATPAELAQAAERMLDLDRTDVAGGLAAVALDRAPAHLSVLSPAARVLLRLGEAPRAREAMERARAERRFALAEDLLFAEVLAADGAPETAVEVLTSACRRFPRSFDAHWRLGRLLLDQDRPEEALDALLIAGPLCPSSPLTIPIGGPQADAFTLGAFEADLEEARERVGEEED